MFEVAQGAQVHGPPILAVWFPNALLSAVATALLSRAARDAGATRALGLEARIASLWSRLRPARVSAS